MKNPPADHRCQVFGSPWAGVYGTPADSARHYGRHWHATYGFGLLEHGAQHSASGRGAVDAYAGDLITTNPGEVHDGRPLGGPSRRWRMMVEGEERSDLAAISPTRHAERFRIPLLIAHGEKDTNVPVSQSRDFLRALTRVGGNVESVFYPEAGHGFSRPEDSIDYLRRVEAFLRRHNPAEAASPASESAQ